MRHYATFTQPRGLLSLPLFFLFILLTGTAVILITLEHVYKRKDREANFKQPSYFIWLNQEVFMRTALPRSPHSQCGPVLPHTCTFSARQMSPDARFSVAMLGGGHTKTHFWGFLYCCAWPQVLMWGGRRVMQGTAWQFISHSLICLFFHCLQSSLFFVFYHDVVLLSKLV